jgi:hypothetical protein
MPRRAVVLDWTIPVVLLAVLTIPFFITDIDMRMARHFYVPGQGFPVGAKPLWWWCKHYGVIPAWILTISALGVFIGSFARPRMRGMRRGALFLVLVMGFGPGLIVNDVFKEHWGRPRPHDLVELGGAREYVPPLVKSPKENGGSFILFRARRHGLLPADAVFPVATPVALESRVRLCGGIGLRPVDGVRAHRAGRAFCERHRVVVGNRIPDRAGTILSDASATRTGRGRRRPPHHRVRVTKKYTTPDIIIL